MHCRLRQSLLLVVAFACVASGSMLAQDAGQRIPSQVIPVVSPPAKRIGPPPSNATLEYLDETGDLLSLQKSYLDAIDYYKAALKRVKPKDHMAAVLHNKIGITQIQLTRFHDAQKSFKKAIKIDKTYSKAYNNLGVVFYYKKKYGKAIKYYKRALLMEPMNASYHCNLGAAYFSKKDIKRSLAQYQTAVEIDPNILQMRSAVGVVAQMSTPEDRAYFCFELAKMYANLGMFDDSLLYLRRAMEEGYKDIGKVYQDEEFAKLRKDERFTALMSQPPPAIR